MVKQKFEFKPEYITDDKSAKAMIDFADDFGQFLAKNKVSTNQIRNAYGNLKKLEMLGWQGATTQRQLLLLKPRLAYTAGRDKKNVGLEALNEVVGSAIDVAIEKQVYFERFCQFFEAIVAYHKAAGGK